MNIERLRRIKGHILEEPLRVNMSTLIHTKDPNIERLLPRMIPTIDKLPPGHNQWPACGTVACICGWENVLYGGQKGIDIWGTSEAVTRLDLPNEFLFFPLYWPRYLHSLLKEHPPGSLPYAQVVAEAIESYISTNGWQDMVC